MLQQKPSRRRNVPWLLFLLLITAIDSFMLLPMNDYSDFSMLYQEALPPLEQFLFVASQLMISPPRTKTGGPLVLPPPPPPLSLIPGQRAALLFLNGQTINSAAASAPSIRLTTKEQELFALIQDFRNTKCPDTTIRIAGGWVRDKLLRREENSSDIDFVTSNISGKQFARLFQEYILERQQQSDAEGESDTTSSLLLLKATNILELVEVHESKEEEEASSSSSASSAAEGLSSQHLETATLQIGDFEIDVCHLRYDKYNKDSRVPETSILASPVQDAWRRDLTINSLFYNIQSDQIEDWTERGLKDLLYNRRVATPKQPLPTLLQDPLRILRAIRFAAQFSFSMDKALIHAAKDPQVQVSLQMKLSNTRKAKELNAIFKTNNPSLGIQLLLETSLLPLLLPSSTDKEKTEDDDITIWQDGLQVLSTTQRLVSKLFTKTEDWNESSRRYLWYAAFLHPYYKRQEWKKTMLSPSTTANKRKSLLFDLLNTQLFLSKGEVQTIESIIKGTNGIQSLLQQMDTAESNIEDLRWSYYQTLKQVGPLWKESLLLSLVLSYSQEVEQKEGTTTTNSAAAAAALEVALNQYVELQNKMDAVGLNSSNILQNKIPPLLNGSQVQEILPRVPKGIAFKNIMKAQERWQVSHNAISQSGEEEEEDYSRNERQQLELMEHLKRIFPEYA